MPDQPAYTIFPLGDSALTIDFGNSIDVGLAKISIADPVKDTTNIQVTQDTIVKLKLENFEIISKPPLTPMA